MIPPSGSLVVTASIGIDFQTWTCGTATQTRYCTGKAGTNGVPVWGDDRALFGGALELTVREGLPHAVPVVMLGVGQNCTAVPPFGTLAVNQIIAFPLAAFDAAEVASSCITIPDDPSMLGFSFLNQAWFADPGAAGFPVAHTEGIELKRAATDQSGPVLAAPCEGADRAQRAAARAAGLFALWLPAAFLR